MDQKTQYHQLQPEDRMTIASMQQQGFSARAMARALGRSPSTVTRERQRNTLTALPYGSHTAQVTCASRRVAARPPRKLDFNGVGWATVRTLLDWKWSPQQMVAPSVISPSSSMSALMFFIAASNGAAATRQAMRSTSAVQRCRALRLQPVARIGSAPAVDRWSPETQRILR